MNKVDSIRSSMLHCRIRGDGTTEGSILPHFSPEQCQRNCNCLEWSRGYESVVTASLKKLAPSFEVELATVNLQYGRLVAVSYEEVGDE